MVIKGMIKSSLDNKQAFLREALALEKEGCQIIRLAVEKERNLKVIDILKRNVSVPIEADVHFDYRLALLSIERGADTVRLNPLNINKISRVREVVRAAIKNKVPLRVAVNSGGIRKKMPDNKLALALAGKVISYVKIIEKEGFGQIVVSAKTNCVKSTILANSILYDKLDYPIDLGLTATGPYTEGLVKSSVALGVLLYQGIGSALRVSLNSSSVEEVRAAKSILQSLGLRYFYPEIISCPTCSRCNVDLRTKVEDLKKFIYKKGLNSSGVRVALMGCPVNGPGEASSADIGIAFGRNFGMLFKSGRILKRIDEGRCLSVLKDYIEGGSYGKKRA